MRREAKGKHYFYFLSALCIGLTLLLSVFESGFKEELGDDDVAQSTHTIILVGACFSALYTLVACFLEMSVLEADTSSSVTQFPFADTGIVVTFLFAVGDALFLPFSHLFDSPVAETEFVFLFGLIGAFVGSIVATAIFLRSGARSVVGGEVAGVEKKKATRRSDIERRIGRKYPKSAEVPAARRRPVSGGKMHIPLGRRGYA